MLKEMTLLIIVLWGSQGMPTTLSQGQRIQSLSELYCKAEALLREYKSDGDKVLPPESRPTMASVFSQPGCNFTIPAEECQILRAFNALFLWLQSSYPQEGLLKSVADSFTLLIQLQESHVRYACLDGASDKVPQITCPKFRSKKPGLENKFHYIFELYRNHTRNLWLSKLTEEERNATLCGPKD